MSTVCGNYRIFLSFWFYVKSKLTNLVLKNLPENTCWSSEIWSLLTFALSEQNSEPTKWQKGQFFNFYILQNWFHVKSEWQNNSEISTLCSLHKFAYLKRTHKSTNNQHVPSSSESLEPRWRLFERNLVFLLSHNHYSTSCGSCEKWVKLGATKSRQFHEKLLA